MKAVVCGGRHGWKGVEAELDKLHKVYGFNVVIEGGARGVDAQAKRWAKKNGVAVETYPAEWNQHGRSAGPRRNQRMINQGKPDLVIAFPGGAGTGDMVLKSLSAKVRVVQVTEAGWTTT